MKSAIKKFKQEETVTNYYNSKNETSQDRLKSPILALRNFNNTIKNLLIKKTTDYIYSEYGYDYKISVFDIGGGRGGDLGKYKNVNINHLVLADIAENSVKEAKDRYKKLNCKFNAEFFVGDCWKKGVLDEVDAKIGFDIVSSQFCLHYSFETEEKARSAIFNIASRLKSGGYFIGTIPDANYIVKKICSVNGLSFGNEYFNIEFEQKNSFPIFGSKYLFSLTGAVDKVPEFLINIKVLERLLEPYGVSLMHYSTFQKFYNQSIHLTKDQFDVAAIYSLFIFKKK